MRAGRLHLHLLGRHIADGALEPKAGVGAGEVRNAEVDDLYRIVGQHENVAGLEVAVNQPALVGGLQAPAGLGDDLDGPVHGQTLRLVLDDAVQGRPRQQRHHEVRFLDPVFLELPHVVDVDDIRVIQRRQNSAFFAEHFQRQLVAAIAQRLQRHFAFEVGVEGAIHHAHAAFAEYLALFVTAFDSSA